MEKLNIKEEARKLINNQLIWFPKGNSPLGAIATHKTNSVSNLSH